MAIYRQFRLLVQLLRGFEVTYSFADKIYMNDKRAGKTGLTQKEAIFRIFKNALGSQFQPGMDVTKIICTKVNNYGPAKWDSSLLNRIVHEIFIGLKNGSIPSKYNSDPREQFQREYASRIAHYWMKHDKRLNGAVSGTRMAATKKKKLVLEERLRMDSPLQAMRNLYFQQSEDVARFEIETYMMGRVFLIVLETFGIPLEAIPQDVREHLKIDSYFPDKTSEAA